MSSCKSLKYDKGKPFNIEIIELIFPIKIPVLPLKYSNGSGFFFCGIIDEPVTNLSFKVIMLNASEFQIMSSSAILEMCKEQAREEYKKSKTKSLSDTVSTELFVGFLNLSFFVV